MTDIDRAEEYCNNEVPFDTTENGENLYTEKDLKYTYLAGLKVGRQEKWHDLRKNPKDLPAENQEVLVYFTLPDKSKNAVTLAEFKNNDFNYVDLQDVIAWYEIPNFRE